ncbi:hypothetical protein BH23GEM5_BH23GEM5_00660 [soil metagenome]
MRRRALQGSVVGLLLAGSACQVVDRVRNRGVAADTSAPSVAAGPLTLGMQAPSALRPGVEGTFILSLTNSGDTVAHSMRLEMLIPGWMEPVPPRAGERQVTMAASAEEGILISYRMDDQPLKPGETQTVEQRIRIPSTSPVTTGARPWSRTVRARLLSPDGQPLAEVESEIALEGTTDGDTFRVQPEAPTAEERERLGAVRLGMTTAALRQAAAGVRDTSWMQEGVQQRGVVVPVARQGRAVAVLRDDTVARIEVRDTLPRTREGLGVGSRLGELRAAYGTACAAVGEGEVVAWFPAAPGISFALDAPIPTNPQQVRGSADRLPASARVTRWWLRRGLDRCP